MFNRSAPCDQNCGSACLLVQTIPNTSSSERINKTQSPSKNKTKIKIENEPEPEKDR